MIMPTAAMIRPFSDPRALACSWVPCTPVHIGAMITIEESPADTGRGHRHERTDRRDAARVAWTVPAACRAGARTRGAGRADARFPGQHAPVRPARPSPG